MEVQNIKVAFLDDILNDVGLSYNVENTRIETIISLANKKNRSEAKFLTMIPITFRVKATLAWYVEFDTAKVGVRRWSNSIMHSVLKNGLKFDHFEIENEDDQVIAENAVFMVECIRKKYNEGLISKREAKKRIKKATPGSFFYTSRITMSYENLRAMYHDRINHELDWWQKFLHAFKDIPYYKEFIVGVKNDKGSSVQEKQLKWQ